MIQKVDFFLPDSSQYGVLQHFTTKFYEAMVRRGLDCRLLAGDDRLSITQADPPDLTIGFNGALFDESGACFHTQLERPHISCLVDPPYRFLNLVNEPYVIVACDDQNSCQELRSYGHDKVVFLPHAVEPDLVPSNESRSYDVIMLATYISCDWVRDWWTNTFSKDLQGIIEGTLSIVQSDDMTSAVQAFHMLHQERLGPVNLPKGDYTTILTAIELYLKGADRIALIDAIEDIPIHIFGSSYRDVSSWEEHYAGKKKNVIVHSDVPYSEALSLMAQSKCVLCSNNKNKRGAHERIFTAAALESIVVTNTNPFLRQSFQHEKDLLFYRPNAIDQINEALTTLFEDDIKRQQMGQNARSIVLQEHTWDHRVDTLLKESPWN